jgi:hypothetical protein
MNNFFKQNEQSFLTRKFIFGASPGLTQTLDITQGTWLSRQKIFITDLSKGRFHERARVSVKYKREILTFVKSQKLRENLIFIIFHSTSS